MEVKDLKGLISELELEVAYTSSNLKNYLNKKIEVLQYKPISGGWSNEQILEHIGLTSHFLLILIDKMSKKALLNSTKFYLEQGIKEYEFNYEKLSEIGKHGSFEWIRPEHMEPKGLPLEEVRVQLEDQFNQCLHYLDLLKNGEGVMYKIMMSVNGLGKISVYEYIYFLVQHANRHITQMDKNISEFIENGK